MTEGVHSRVLNREGVLHVAGTSYSAPKIAGFLEHIRTTVGDDGFLLSKALLFAVARDVGWSPESELVDPRYVVGHGCVTGDEVFGPDDSRVLLLRQGTITPGRQEEIRIQIPDWVGCPGRGGTGCG